MSKNHQLSSGRKKPAPPRPPPPTQGTGTGTGNVKTSKSFRTAGELESQKRIQSKRGSYTGDNRNRNGGGDLIDFGTPPDSPEEGKKVVFTGTGINKEPPDYMYRVGASIFYVRSQLKNPGQSNPVSNPFSPPRPSAQAMLASPAKNPTYRTSTLYSNVPTQSQPGSIKGNPTIIKRPTNSNESNNNVMKPGGFSFGYGESSSIRSSSGSSDWSDYSQTSSTNNQQQRYGNIPVAWDEPIAQNDEPLQQHPHQPQPQPQPQPQQTKTVVVPTIIKPPIATKPSLLPKPNLGGFSLKPGVLAAAPVVKAGTEKRESWNYYDEPPDGDFDFDEEGHEDSYVSPPMPNEPPPPPPSDVADFVENTVAAVGEYAESESTYANQQHQQIHAETDRAYAIALYDYLPDVEGDLPLQAGDLVYLMKKIDDQWLYGHCAGVEGIFPANFVNVVVPLVEENEDAAQQGEAVQPYDPEKYWLADAIYQFDAEAEGDLALRMSDMVKIYGRLNEDWLYGEVAGKVGQFPATFVEPVPSDLPTIPTGS